jgi:hypothetical protein
MVGGVVLATHPYQVGFHATAGAKRLLRFLEGRDGRVRDLTSPASRPLRSPGEYQGAPENV